jgi:hypothetical protein
MASRSDSRPKSMRYLGEHFKLTKKQKKALLFLLSLPSLARKTIGAPRIAKTIWETKICMSHEYGPNPINHPKSLWITQCWKNATPFFSQELLRAIEKFTLEDTENDSTFFQIEGQIPAIVEFYNYAQKMKKDMSMTERNTS